MQFNYPLLPQFFIQKTRTRQACRRSTEKRIDDVFFYTIMLMMIENGLNNYYNGEKGEGLNS